MPPLPPQQPPIPPISGDPTMIAPPVQQAPTQSGLAAFENVDVQDETPGEAAELDQDFNDNLAETIPEDVLNVISNEIIEGIQSDLESRQEWESSYAKGVQMLGLKMEDASGDISSGGTVSKVYHQLLLESVVRYQSNGRAELLPVDGPVKVRNDSPTESLEAMQTAEALEKDVNHYLTVIDKDYYPDFDQMLFDLGFCGMAFRKLYHCPLKNRPVDEFVSALDMIVSNDAKGSLTNVGRYTQRIMMRQGVLKRLQLAGFYREVGLILPNEDLDEAQRKILEVEGLSPLNTLPRDQRHTIYESYVDYDLAAYDEFGKAAGYPLPYRVTLDKDSTKILEIRRNWKEDDPDFKPRRRFVKYGYVPGLGFYDYGLIHLIGNTERALTAIERQLLDAGQFSNFPGFLFTKQAGRQDTNQIRVAPGSGQGIDTGGLPITSAVMALPYKEPSAVLAAVAKDIEAGAMRLSGVAEVPVGEGRADIPVGTMVALVEQATKVLSAVHKRNHCSQQEEFEILMELFREDPEALWRFAKNPARKWQMAEELNDMELVTAADPNTPSHIHRIMKAMALGQMVQAYPQEFNVPNVLAKILGILGFDDIQNIMAPPQAQAGPPPNPEAENIKLQSQARAVEQDKEKEQDVIRGNYKIEETKLNMQNDAAERETKLKLESMKMITKLHEPKKDPLGKSENKRLI